MYRALEGTIGPCMCVMCRALEGTIQPKRNRHARACVCVDVWVEMEKERALERRGEKNQFILLPLAICTA